MKKLLLALALLLTPASAWAQCNGVFANNTVCGNATGSSNLPRPTSPSAFSGTAGGTNGQIQYNNSGTLGGLTDPQVTAHIGQFTSVLSGAVPASGGGTTNFIRADGTWAAPVGTSGTTQTYGTRALAVAATIPTQVLSVIIEGYTTANDGGGGLYTKLSGAPTVKAWHFQSADGAWWQLTVPQVYPKQVGAKLDASTDDSTAMQAWLDYGAAFSVVSAGQSGTAVIPSVALNLTDNQVVDGLNALTIKRTTDVVGSLLDCTSHSNITIRNTTFDTSAGFSGTGSNTIGLTSQSYTVPAGLTLTVGKFVQITANTSSSVRINYEIAQITAYSGTTLTVTATTAVGSGTYAAWLIDVYPDNGDLAASNIAVRLTACTNVTVQDNTVNNRFYNAYDSRNSKHIYFVRNKATGYVNRGIHAAAYLAGNSAADNQILNNYLNGNNFSQYGINISASDVATAAYFVTTGNVVVATTYQGILIGGGVSFSTIEANSVTLANTTTAIGIIVEGLVGSGGLQSPQHIGVVNNHIAAGLYGIFVTDTIYSNFASNTVSGAGGSCYLFQGSTSADVAYNAITGNIGQSCGGSGISLNGLSVAGAVNGNSVIGNTMIVNAGYGITSTANTSNNNYSGNVALSNGTAAYSIAGTGNVTTGGNL